MFDRVTENSSSLTRHIGKGRIAFLTGSSLAVLLLILALFAVKTGGKEMQMLAIGLFGLSLILSLFMMCAGVLISTIVSIRRQPRLFWICGTIYGSIPFLYGILCG